MTDSSKDAGVIQVVVERLEKWRLPRVLAMKEKVDRGEVLDQFDIEFLEEVMEDANNLMPMIDRHPEWQDLAARMMHLYKQITERALKNEGSQP